MYRDMFMLGFSARMLAGSEDTAEVLLYGRIIGDVPDETWKWSKEDKSASEFDKEIKKVRQAGATKLLLRINSPGGMCHQSVAMRTILAGAGFDEITIRIEGLCASAATDIATLPGAHVQIAEGSEYMIHNPWNYIIGNAEDMEHEAEHLRSIEQVTRGFYAQKSGQSDEKIKEWMDRETWFSAEEAVQYGFCDELLRAEKKTAGQAAACVTSAQMAAMRAIYKGVPKEIMVEEAAPMNADYEPHAAGDRINTTPNKEEKGMETKDLTTQQLQTENPELYNQMMQAGAAQERQRIAEIDSLTLPGYEAMAEEAKQNGTSSMDFHRQIVEAQKKKAQAFLSARQQETAPAAQVTGESAEDHKKQADNEDEEIRKNAKLIADYAAGMTSNNETMY